MNIENLNDSEVFELIIEESIELEEVIEYIESNNYTIFKDLYNYLKDTNNLNNLEASIANDYSYCNYCEELVESNELYYLEGSTTGYYNLIYENDLEYDNDIELTEDLANYVFENIGSEFDDIFYCDNCLNIVIREVNSLILQYKEREGAFNQILDNYDSNCDIYCDYRLNKVSNHSIGLEIELGFKSYDYSLINYLESIKNDLFYLEKDGSLKANYNLEAITNILDIDYIEHNKIEFKEFFNTIEPYLDNNTSHGGHIHIGNIKNKDNVYNTLKEFFIKHRELLENLSKREKWFYCNFDNLNDNYQRYKPIVNTSNTIEFRLWSYHNNFNDMITRTYITLFMVILSENNELTINNLKNTIEAFINNPIKPKYDFSFYLETIEAYLKKI